MDELSKQLWILIILATALKACSAVSCSSCPDTDGHIVGCALTNSEGYLLHRTDAFSLLHCFDKCLRETKCQFYEFASKPAVLQEPPCKLYSKFETSFLETNLISKHGTTFSRMDSRMYSKWLVPACQANGECQSSSSVLSQGLCDKQIDLVFLLDNSVTPELAFSQEKQFVLNVAEKFRLDSTHTIPSVITYSGDAAVPPALGLRNFTTYLQFQADVKSIGKSSYVGSRYDLALTQAAENIFTFQGGARRFAHRVVVLLANNNLPSNVPINTELIKESLQRKCARTFVVRAGSLTGSVIFASSPDYVYKVDPGFSTLDSNNYPFNDLVSKICSAFG